MGTQDLSNSQLDALKDIFGDAAAGGAYSGQQVGRLEGGTNGVEAIIQVVKNEEGYVAPDDYRPLQASQTRQPRMSTTSLRIALTTQLPKATNVSLTTSATTAPSSPTEVASSTSGTALAS